ncbi:hypothetical protein VZT92_002231 [Zoarces viviparus]|uniref:Uncharacterized protein n=1 Tax=Zoarces viviparus TaxID=48416 RepID=A0AAW1FZM9_ZOAVI
MGLWTLRLQRCPLTKFNDIHRSSWQRSSNEALWSCSGYSSSVWKAKMCCFPQSPNKVRTAPCSQQQSSS